jgi:deoxyribonuclease-4
MGNLAIGSHVGGDDPIAAAKELGLDHIQVFLADPQSWKGSIFPHSEGAEGLKASSEAAGIGIYVHARYIINVATTNNKVRIPSRKILQADMDAAAELGAKGLIVHGGHVTADDDPAVGVANWVKAIDQLDMKIPLLLENTAGGKFSMARRLESIARLWDAIGGKGVGFCLDTCHAHAGGIEQVGLAETILKTTGRIDLVHCNNSRDAFDSGADRHANLNSGTMDVDILIQNLKKANAPIILETPYEDIETDLKILRDALV